MATRHWCQEIHLNQKFFLQNCTVSFLVCLYTSGQLEAQASRVFFFSRLVWLPDVSRYLSLGSYNWQRWYWRCLGCFLFVLFSNRPSINWQVSIELDAFAVTHLSAAMIRTIDMDIVPPIFLVAAPVVWLSLFYRVKYQILKSISAAQQFVSNKGINTTVSDQVNISCSCSTVKPLL